MRLVARTETSTQVLAGALNDLDGGRLSNGGVVTLTAGATTTVVARLGVAAGDAVFLSPTTANAAAAAATTFISSTGKNTFTITHANNAQVDRTFRYAFFAVLT